MSNTLPFFAENNFDSYPVIPMRDSVFFPGDTPPVIIGRENSIAALEQASSSDNKIVMVAQVKASVDQPSSSCLYQVGVLVELMQIIKLPDTSVKVLASVKKRVKIIKFLDNEKFITAFVEAVEDFYPEDIESTEIEAWKRSVLLNFKDFMKLAGKANTDFNSLLSKIENADMSKIADAIASNMDIKVEQKQSILETYNVQERFISVYKILEKEIEILRTEKKIRERVKSQMENTQKAYYLNEQLKAIQKELGDNDSHSDFSEIGDLEKRIQKTPLSKEAKEEALNELKKLKMMTPMSAEAGVIRNYLDWILSMPWGKKSRLKTDLSYALKILKNNHYGMDKVKESVIEYLAVNKRTKKLKGPILFLVGPPGVGKTSLAESIAQATGRDFIRIYLGGVKDESEIKGHRRTYIGAMPGKIIQSLKKSKTSNPLILLDEIDKMGSDLRGDPYSALLEVLDPENNKRFVDHYLGVEYNLSNIMFIATGNSINVPIPLLDRMEVIHLSGYTEKEKLNIANLHILPSLMDDHCISPEEWSISDDGIFSLIRNYTKESGVRNLKRELATLVRKAIKELLTSKAKNIQISDKNVDEYLGVHKYDFGVAEEENIIGAVTGLAYTEVGGELLTIEAVKTPGEGKISSTGKLGDVMKESVEAAYNCLYSKCNDFGIKAEDCKKYNIHIHVPQGAVPKDGPSAGIAMLTAMVSLLTEIPVSKDIAMTGEVTLRGTVLPIGGLKEKLLAAMRGGIKTVVIPDKNQKDLNEIPSDVIDKLNIVPAKDIDIVLKSALIYNISSIPSSKLERINAQA